MNNYIWVKAKVSNYYNIINKIYSIGINIEKIKYINNSLYLKIEYKEYKKLNKYLISTKFTIVRTTGINYIVDIIRKNIIFIISCIIGLILLIILSNMIFKINVIHENGNIRELIMDELKEHGINIFSFKKSFSELEIIKEDILDKHREELDWIEFEVNGLVFSVRVEERIITDTTKSNDICDIVATKNSIINKINVKKGTIQVNINDYVKKGDILVNGDVLYNDEVKTSVCADGEIYGISYYTINVSIPFKYEEYRKTNKYKYNITYELNDIKKDLLKPRFNIYESNYKKILDIFGFRLYINRYEELEKINLEYSTEEALNEGINKAINSLKVKLDKKDTIIDKKVLKKYVNNSTMDIEVFVVTQELISTRVKRN